MSSQNQEHFYGPEFLNRIRSIEKSSGMIVTEFTWTADEGQKFTLGETGFVAIDFVYSEFDELINHETLVSLMANNERVKLIYSHNAPSALTLENINKSLSDDDCELYVEQLNACCLIIKPHEKRFFDDWDQIDSGGHCNMYQLDLGPFFIWVSHEDGLGLPKRNEPFQLGFYKKFDGNSIGDCGDDNECLFSGVFK